jgi:hypothetical protein
VLGLAPDISSAPAYNVLASLIADKALPKPVFSVWLGRTLEDGAEMTFGDYNPNRMKGDSLVWVNVSKVGYWQLQLADLWVNGERLNLGCDCEGCCQAVLDTGSSVMMGPPFLVELMMKHLNVTEDCTGKHFPSLGFVMDDSNDDEQTLVMDEDDYMDRETNNGTDFCWLHMIPMEDTGRGPVLVLGMPFLRKFYSVFDFENKAVGFAVARQPNRTTEGPVDKLVNGSFQMPTEAPQEAAPLKEARPSKNSSHGSVVPLLACRGACFKGKEMDNASAYVGLVDK